MARTGRADSSMESNPDINLSGDENDQSSARGESIALSSIESSLFFSANNFSLNSSEIGAATLGSQSADGGNTIVSSNPSMSMIPPPEASREIFMRSPHPEPTPVGVDSISTTHTEIFPSEQLFQLESILGDRHSTNQDSLSMASSQSTRISTTVPQDQRPIVESFEQGAFERVASRLEMNFPDSFLSDRIERLRQEDQIREDERLARLIELEERLFLEQGRPLQQSRSERVLSSEEEQIRDDELLARFLQEDEHVFSEEEKAQQRTRTKGIFGIPSAIVAVGVALLALVGLTVSKRR